ncbi:hypothetical protein [Paraburkholderia hayleyella]|uniref:hypothetical protein n=1 Tax=Paraburkholderia hayleyella TaxID=2152889 RepID=UPI001FE31C07|nr:hypothetical protein [Paraburkholderia hayleyella]
MKNFSCFSFLLASSSSRLSAPRRLAVMALLLPGVLSLGACGKDDASAHATNALNDMARQASQALGQAASFVGQQVDSARATAQQHLDAALPNDAASGAAASAPTAASAASAPVMVLTPDALASSAQAHLRDTASTVLGKAAGLTGAGLETAGRKLQEWSSQTATGKDGAQPEKTP